MKSLTLFLTLLIFSLPAFAGEKVKGTNFLVADQQSWQTGEGTGYWMLKGEGVQQSLEGPLGTTLVACYGAGFWDQEGSWGEGICVHGAENDTRTSYWKRDKGQTAGEWKILSGTGKYAGMTGQGSYIATQLPGGRIVSEWDGEVTLAQ